MTGTIFEVIDDGAGNSVVGSELTLLGELIGYDSSDHAIWGPLNLSFLGETHVNQPPHSPFLSPVGGTTTPGMPSRTSTSFQWVPAVEPDNAPPVTAWDVERRSSTDNGVTFGAWAAISGSPFAATTLTGGQTGLATGTPEIVWQYRVRGTSLDGVGDYSNVLTLQWGGTPLTPPTAPTSFARGTLFATHVLTSWIEDADPTIVAHRIDRNGSTIFYSGLDASARQFNLTGLTPLTTYTNVNVKRANLAADGVTLQWSPASNAITFSTPLNDPIVSDPLIGVSNSDENHGGFNDWPVWRVYDFTAAKQIANQTGANHPRKLGVTDGGAVFTGYAGTLNTITQRLEDFYYGSGSAARKDVALYLANGNEYGDKVGASAAAISAFVDGCRAYYDASRTLNPDGSRRYPLVKVGLDPTHFQEQKGTSLTMSGGGAAASIAASSGAAAQYCDFNAWSAYPPGRENTVDDPTFTKPSLVESDRTKLQSGFLIRCFYRTSQNIIQARADSGDNTRTLEICVWEIGIGNDPDYNGHRPFYAVHSLIGTCVTLAAQYNLLLDHFIWWDQQTTVSGVLQSDNPLSHEPAATSPSTAEAIRTWRSLNHQFGGTHPASWAGYPVLTGTNPWKGGA